MDETVEEEVVTVGQRLREAREAKEMSVEDIAASTRIPTRHLNSLETGDWDKLPAPTYTIGFAKNYATAVGLDREEIGEQLRTEMGGVRPSSMAYPEVYEAADPARTMPKGLIFGALALLAIVVAGLMWMRNQSLQADPVAEAETNAVDGNALPPLTVPVSAQPVTVTATEAVWVDIRDGEQVLKQGEMAAGERFDVPAGATAPVITTGKPEALQINVGDKTAAAIGEAGKRVSNVSLKGEDLLASAAAAPAPSAQPAAAPPPAPTPTPTRQVARPRPAQTPSVAAPSTASPSPAEPATAQPATADPATPTG